MWGAFLCGTRFFLVLKTKQKPPRELGSIWVRNRPNTGIRRGSDIPESRTSQLHRQSCEICKTSILGSNPGGASEFSEANLDFRFRLKAKRIIRGMRLFLTHPHESPLWHGRGLNDCCGNRVEQQKCDSSTRTDPDVTWTTGARVRARAAATVVPSGRAARDPALAVGFTLGGRLLCNVSGSRPIRSRVEKMQARSNARYRLKVARSLAANRVRESHSYEQAARSNQGRDIRDPGSGPIGLRISSATSGGSVTRFRSRTASEECPASFAARRGPGIATNA
jgi:hypothetical protein